MRPPDSTLEGKNKEDTLKAWPSMTGVLHMLSLIRNCKAGVFQQRHYIIPPGAILSRSRCVFVLSTQHLNSCRVVFLSISGLID